MPNITFIVNGQEKVIAAESGQTILQIALDHDIPMEHSCGGNGFCNTCLCHVKAGAENLSPLNDREEMMGVGADRDRLGCQARVEGDATVEVQ